MGLGDDNQGHGLGFSSDVIVYPLFFPVLSSYVCVYVCVFVCICMLCLGMPSLMERSKSLLLVSIDRGSNIILDASESE